METLQLIMVEKLNVKSHNRTTYMNIEQDSESEKTKYAVLHFSVFT